MIERLLGRVPLSPPEVYELVEELLDPEVPDARKAGMLVAMQAKGETIEELRALADAMLQRAVPVRATGALDTCGTGGDSSGSLNLSTAAALVAAAAGAPVCKHGNRAVSSRCGSADVLEALGVPLVTDPVAAEQGLARTGFVFLLAPAFHPATRAVAPARRALAIRTVFNLLGPLTNPARPAFQLTGAADPRSAELLAGALLGHVRRAYVVHGDGGWDEATPVGPFRRWTVDGSVRHEVIDPLSWGIPRCRPEDLAGGSPSENAESLMAVFRGQRGPRRDAIVLSAALALEVAGVAAERAAVRLAQQALDSGAVVRLCEVLRG